MSRHSIHISIPQPCHESWDRMDATARGAFCHSCQKEVIDFSAMTDREVVEYLQKYQTGCGRFRKDQLNTKLTIPMLDNGVFKWKAFVLSFLSLISIKNLIAQSGGYQPSAKQLEMPKDSLTKKESKPTSLPQVEVKGFKRPLIQREATILGMYIDTSIRMPMDTTKPSGNTIKLYNSKGANAERLNGDHSLTINGGRPDDVVYIINGTFHVTKAQRIKYWFHRTFQSKR